MKIEDLGQEARKLFGSFCDRMASIDLRAAAALPAAIGVCTALYGVGLEVHGQGELLQHGGSMAVDAYRTAMQAVPIDSITEYVRLAFSGAHRSFGGNEQGIGFGIAAAGPVLTTASVLLSRGFKAIGSFLDTKLNELRTERKPSITDTFAGGSMALQASAAGGRASPIGRMPEISSPDEAEPSRLRRR
jgi:hypothetical protein